MTVLLDTSVLIDHLRGNAGAGDGLAGAVSAECPTVSSESPSRS